MPNTEIQERTFQSRLSLLPLVQVLKKMIAESKPGARRLYQGLIREIESKPDLLQTMDDTRPIAGEAELVETLLSTIFPPATSSNQGWYAIILPFSRNTVYASPGFRRIFLKESETAFSFQNDHSDLDDVFERLAYSLILKKFFGGRSTSESTSVHAFVDESGLTRYNEVNLNAQFVDVIVDNDFELPKEFDFQQALDLEELRRALPIEHFGFAGLMVLEVNDVTGKQAIQEVKNALLNINSFSDVMVYDDLQQHVQSLMGLKNLQIGITPFFKMNEYYLYTESLYKSSILFRSAQAIRERDHISDLCQEVFGAAVQPVLYEDLHDEERGSDELLRYYREQGTRGLIICPLRCDNGDLIGLLEMSSQRPGELQPLHLAKAQPAVSLFSLALEKSREALELQIDKMIKEHFTAVQPAVEWKFTEAAFQYIQHRQVSELAKMPNITFEEVYPMYAAIDVRNSSTQRSQSIQKDLQEQLEAARELLKRCGRVIEFPLLDETGFRIEKYLAAISENLLSDDELVIYEFLQNDLDSLLKNLQHTRPELRKLIDGYFALLDPQRNVIYHHRREYEESITRINDVLDRFIDAEQKEAQEVYPHYFERYVTDGIEFNMYVGQCLSPARPFNEMYVRHLKRWQLTQLWLWFDLFCPAFYR